MAIGDIYLIKSGVSGFDYVTGSKLFTESGNKVGFGLTNPQEFFHIGGTNNNLRVDNVAYFNSLATFFSGDALYCSQALYIYPSQVGFNQNESEAKFGIYGSSTPIANDFYLNYIDHLAYFSGGGNAYIYNNSAGINIMTGGAGGVVSNIVGFYSSPTLLYSDALSRGYACPDVSNFSSFYSKLLTQASMSGTITTGANFVADTPLINATKHFANYFGLLVRTSANGINKIGLTFNNYGAYFDKTDSVAGSGSVINNYGVYIVVATGIDSSTGTTSNYGIYITSGSPGAYPIYVNSTGKCFISGSLGIGSLNPITILEVSKPNSNTTITTLGDPAITILNPNTTNNSFSSLVFRSVNDSGSLFSVARVSAVCTNHTSGSQAGDSVFLTTSGSSMTEKMRILARGDVVINGTSNILGKLTVYGSSTRYADLGINAISAGTFRYDDNSAANVTIFENRDITAIADQGVRLRFNLANNNATTAIEAGRISVLKESVWTTGTDNSSYMAFNVRNTATTLVEIARFTSSGFFGIGTGQVGTTFEVVASNNNTGFNVLTQGTICVTNRNASTTNNYSQIAFRTFNNSGISFLGTIISSVFKSRVSGLESGDFVVSTINSGTTAEKFRVTSAGQSVFANLNFEPGTASNGSIYYNTTLNKFRGYQNSSWNNLIDPNLAITTKTTNYTLTIGDDLVLFDGSAGNVTGTLPSSVGLSGEVFSFIRLDASGTSVVITGSSSQTINGQLSYTGLSTQYSRLRVVSDNSNYLILSI